MKNTIDIVNLFSTFPYLKKTLDEIRYGMLKGDIPCYGEENPYGRTFYEDAIACTLSNAVESGEISEDEYEIIYSFYVF